MTSHSDVLLVDWLGRGGIAQTTFIWHQELIQLGHTPLVVTRGGRELSEFLPDAVTVSSRFGPTAEHAKLVATVVATTVCNRPEWVVLSGSVLPHLELSVVLAAKARGTQVCFIAHESTPPNDLLLANEALRAIWRLSDIVVVHSSFVARAVTATAPRTRLKYVPQPNTQRLESQTDGQQSLIADDERLTVLTFGQLQKTYKGANLVSLLAEEAGDEWRFVLVGSGIPSGLSPRVEQHSGFYPIGQLAATVAAADIVLLPYSRASQSGAIILAQWAGTPVISTDVGGISEQIIDGDTGLLVPAGGDVEPVLAALNTLVDPLERSRLSRRAASFVQQQHELFVDCLRELFSG